MYLKCDSKATFPKYLKFTPCLCKSFKKIYIYIFLNFFTFFVFKKKSCRLKLIKTKINVLIPMKFLQNQVE